MWRVNIRKNKYMPCQQCHFCFSREEREREKKNENRLRRARKKGVVQVLFTYFFHFDGLTDWLILINPNKLTLY
jgi:hypothetical protein